MWRKCLDLSVLSPRQIVNRKGEGETQPRSQDDSIGDGTMNTSHMEMPESGIKEFGLNVLEIVPESVGLDS